MVYPLAATGLLTGVTVWSGSKIGALVLGGLAATMWVERELFKALEAPAREAAAKLRLAENTIQRGTNLAHFTQVQSDAMLAQELFTRDVIDIACDAIGELQPIDGVVAGRLTQRLQDSTAKLTEHSPDLAAAADEFIRTERELTQ